MANQREFAKQNTERALDAALSGMNWFQDLTEQSLNQSKSAYENWLTTTRKLAHEVDAQASSLLDHSLALAEQTMSNSLDFGQKLVRLRDPQDLIQLQAEYVAQQAQTIADQSKELVERVRQGSEQLANNTVRATAAFARKQPKVVKTSG